MAPSNSHPTRTGEPAPGHRRSVVTYLGMAFGSALLALVVLMAYTTVAAFDRERARVATILRSAARDTAESVAAEDAQTAGFIAQMSANPLLATLDPRTCAAAFAGLDSILTMAGHLHVLAADGQQVCGVGSQEPLAVDDRLAKVLGTNVPATLPPSLDPVTGSLASTIVAPIPNSQGGVLVAVFNMSGWGESQLPAGLPDDAVVTVLDRETSTVVRRIPDGTLVGRSASGSDFGRPVGAGGATLVDLDGRQRLYYEADSGPYRVLVGLPSSKALAEARLQLVRTSAFGFLTVALLGGLGLLLHRRIARPVRRLTVAIRAAGTSDDSWAPVEGPEELAEMAVAFNEMLTDRRQREAELRYRAAHDVLTGLPNRARIGDVVDESIEGGGLTAVLFLDLDRFKFINDSHGHSVGDALLVELAERLVEAAGEGCMVGRFGGDEFVILSPSDQREAVAVAERVLATVSQPFEINGHYLYVTGSIGIVVARPGDSAEDVLRFADTAMYRAKASGRANHVFFDEEMRAWTARRLQVERDLLVALERREFVLHYQPKFSLETEQLVGFEALVRWNHPERGLVPPGDFIPVAEEAGLIEQLGNWVIHEACRQIDAWRREGLIVVPVAVNIAPSQLTRPDFVSFVAGTLAHFGITGQNVVFEITESAVLADPFGAAEQLRRLRRLGIQVSLDDFGTGYSSLSHLQQFPVGEVKIDRSFISRLSQDASSHAIVGSIVRLAQAIGLAVVAEGVETQQQVDELRNLGCQMAQGYLLGRPVAAPDAAGRMSKPWPASAQVGA